MAVMTEPSSSLDLNAFDPVEVPLGDGLGQLFDLPRSDRTIFWEMKWPMKSADEQDGPEGEDQDAFRIQDDIVHPFPFKTRDGIGIFLQFFPCSP